MARWHPVADTGIGSVVQPGATGNGGAVNVQAAGTLAVIEGGVISSETAGAGNGGAISIAAGALTMDNALNQAVQSGILSFVDGQGQGMQVLRGWAPALAGAETLQYPYRSAAPSRSIPGPHSAPRHSLLGMPETSPSSSRARSRST